jgi:hypothetical protein
MSTWTIEKELLLASGEKEVKSALISLGIIPGDTSWCHVRELGEWTRAGSETYTYEFIVESDLATRHLIAKACVALGPGSSVGEISREWLRRRKLLTDSGVNTPRLYSAVSATMIEEYIPFTLVDAYKMAASDVRVHVSSELGRILGIISRLAFLALSLHDLRSRGEDIVVIDFGEDLGPPGVTRPGQVDLIDHILTHFEQNDLRLRPSELQALSAEFERQVALS